MTDLFDLTSEEATHQLNEALSEPLQVVPTGLPTLDASQLVWGGGQGIPQGEYVVIGGKSGHSKTQLGIALLKQATRHGVVSGIVSMEMRKRDVSLRRHLSLPHGIPFAHWAPGRWSRAERRALLEASRKAAEEELAPIFINNKQGADLPWVLLALDTMAAAGATFVVVDHLQLIRADGYRGGDIAGRTAEVSESIRDWAFGRDVTVVALCQINRTAADRMDRYPDMSDLYGGTSVESNAQQILVLDHTAYRVSQTKPWLHQTWLFHAKNRSGPARRQIPIAINQRAILVREAKDDEVASWPRAEDYLK